ncbi:methyl-accepting chemotaxis protein [Vibrio sp. SCSIO 43136]|uniref:methyl-accepting chemotaxis protein n=1 Tax=Vibrio sp. SCSIO 43136 TaxID=2819101 RepID=UPI002074C0DA|nr:methyl-accepting chemotaxis protein [Vibrio sp. SCSIO 43136]USD67663.1 methyl-accepting chemotaxis protein [Vibrio sp. SCSIO 43136]
MKIATKIIVACASLCALGVIGSGAFVAYRASTLSEQALFTRATSQLVSIREAKKDEITRYFEFIEQQLIAMAASPATQDAFEAFSSGFESYPIEKVTSSDRQKLSSYYQSSFASTYHSSNQGQNANEGMRLNQISERGVALQARYIGVNSHGLGEKHRLDADGLGTSYDQTHLKYHPATRLFLENFGYYDIFFVDNQGNVVYSVFKELDYATNLVNGPYRDSGLAQAFRMAQNHSSQQISLVDFAPYYPSYEAAASFMSTPVFKAGKRLGTLIFQMPVDEINSIMTNGGRWVESGLGSSGETYLVGSDKLLRSQSRFLLEDMPSYLQALKLSGLSDSVLTQIKQKQSAIGRQPVNSKASNAALGGTSGVELVLDYRNVEVFSAYTPLEVSGLRWALLSEIDKDEALADLNVLNSAVFNSVALSSLVLVLLSSGCAYVVGAGIVKPIRKAIYKVGKISQQNDLTGRLNEDGRDEVADLAKALNGLFTSLQAIIQDVAMTSTKVHQTVGRISTSMGETRRAVNDQYSRTDTMATAVNEMSASVAEVAQFASKAADSMNDANQTGQKSAQVGQELASQMGELELQMQEANQATERLLVESNSIAEVLDVIQSIAEQTNLLALNAAIEAARAGEQGRGFAVVADEVRTLASRTQSSTEEIRTKIESLQRETNAVASSISGASSSVVTGLERCNTNGEMLEQIVSMLNELSDMNTQIATAATEQSQVTDEISAGITSIAESSLQVSGQTDQIDAETSGLSEQSDVLNHKVSQFRY